MTQKVITCSFWKCPWKSPEPWHSHYTKVCNTWSHIEKVTMHFRAIPFEILRKDGGENFSVPSPHIFSLTPPPNIFLFLPGPPPPTHLHVYLSSASADRTFFPDLSPTAHPHIFFAGSLSTTYFFITPRIFFHQPLHTQPPTPAQFFQTTPMHIFLHPHDLIIWNGISLWDISNLQS